MSIGPNSKISNKLAGLQASNLIITYIQPTIRINILTTNYFTSEIFFINNTIIVKAARLEQANKAEAVTCQIFIN